MSCNFQNLSLYESRDYLVFSGFQPLSIRFFILEITRTSYDISTDPKITLKSFSNIDFEHYIKKLNLTLIYDKISCIYGFIQLSISHYIIIVTKSEPVANIHDRIIYKVKETEMIPIGFKLRNTMEETKYRNILSLESLNDNVYFSYDYSLIDTLQDQYYFKENSTTLSAKHQRNQFIWNFYSIQPYLEQCLMHEFNQFKNFVVPLIYGFIKQHTFELIDSRKVKVTLIARRSRHFAGTRYLRRGVNILGHAANEVESEQILTLISSLNYSSCRSSSFVQCRGSIPICWSHVNLLAPSPDTIIEDADTDYEFTKAHFQKLVDLYGPNINILNLIRQSNNTKEEMLGNEFQQCYKVLLNQSMKCEMNYFSFDILNKAINKIKDLIALLQIILDKSGIFFQPEKLLDNNSNKNFIQNGILRTNCIDCLDRTNLSQFLIAKLALIKQFKNLCLYISTSSMELINKILLSMWIEHGDRLAIQYSGSPSMHQFHEQKSKKENFEAGDSIDRLESLEYDTLEDVPIEKEISIISNSARNAMIAVQRYYSNVTLDYERQQAIDIFTGFFVPSKFLNPSWHFDLSPNCNRTKVISTNISDKYFPRWKDHFFQMNSLFSTLPHIYIDSPNDLTTFSEIKYNFDKISLDKIICEKNNNSKDNLDNYSSSSSLFRFSQNNVRLENESFPLNLLENVPDQQFYSDYLSYSIYSSAIQDKSLIDFYQSSIANGTMKNIPSYLITPQHSELQTNSSCSTAITFLQEKSLNRQKFNSKESEFLLDLTVFPKINEFEDDQIDTITTKGGNIFQDFRSLFSGSQSINDDSNTIIKSSNWLFWKKGI